jgi:hypothetical protein
MLFFRGLYEREFLAIFGEVIFGLLDFMFYGEVEVVLWVDFFMEVLEWGVCWRVEVLVFVC